MAATRPQILPPQLVLPLLGLFVALGAWIRLQGIGRSLGHDEIYTVVIFASRSWLDILTAYDLPNNHILHTLCVRLTIGLLGGHDWAVRLPALLAGVAGIPAIYWFTRHLTGAPTVSLLAAFLLGTHDLHIRFSQQARGYTLLVLLGLLYAGSLWAALGPVLRPSARGSSGSGPAAATPRTHRTLWPWVGTALFGTLAVLTIPSAALLVGAGTLGASLLIRRSAPGPRAAAMLPLALATLTIGLLAGLVYLPQLDQMRNHATRFGQPLSILEAPAFIAAVWERIGPLRWGWAVQGVSLWGLITLEGARRGAGLFLGTLLGAPLLLNIALGTQAEPRLYLFLVPFALVPVATGAESLRRLSQRHVGAHGWRRVLATAPVVMGALSFSAGLDPPVETGYRDAGVWVRQRTQPGDLIIVPYVMDAAIGYYSHGATVERQRQAVEAGIRRLLFVTRPGTDRFRLGDLMLATNFTTDAGGHRDTYRHIAVPVSALRRAAHFDLTEAFGSRGDLQPVDLGDLHTPDAWYTYHASRPDAAGMTTIRGAGAGAYTGAATPHGAAPALRVDPGTAGALVLHSRRTFRPARAGLAVLGLSKGGDGYASLYELTGGESPSTTTPGGGAGAPQAVQMVTPLSASAVHRGPGGIRYADLALAPLQAGRTYGLFLTARGVVEASRWQLHFLPYPDAGDIDVPVAADP